MTSDTPKADETPTTKVGKLIERYEFNDAFGERLEAYWLGDGTERKSLRDLADLFNREVLTTAMEEAGMDPLDGEVENTYRLLTSEDVSSGVRTEARKRLERHGVDIDRIESDFVTYQAIRTYLRDVRDATYEKPSAEDRIESVDETIKRLQSRTVSVTQEKLGQLAETEQVELGQFRILLDLQVFCEDCGTQYEVGELLERGGCNCSDGG